MLGFTECHPRPQLGRRRCPRAFFEDDSPLRSYEGMLILPQLDYPPHPFGMTNDEMPQDRIEDRLTGAEPEWNFFISGRHVWIYLPVMMRVSSRTEAHI